MNKQRSESIYEHCDRAAQMLEAGKDTLHSLTTCMDSDDPPSPELISALSEHAHAAIQAGNLHMRIAEFLKDL